MADKSYRTYQPDQVFLLPPSMRDWLPDGHLVYFVLDVVEGLDLSAIELPEELRRRQDRLRRIEEARAELEAEAKAAREAELAARQAFRHNAGHLAKFVAFALSY